MAQNLVEQKVYFQYSLAQLLLGVAIWPVCIGGMATLMKTELPDWGYSLVATAAVIALVMLLSKQRNGLIAAFLSLPTVCLLNLATFFIAGEYVFGNEGMSSSVLGPIAYGVSSPMVFAQNIVPLTRPWDTIFGIIAVSIPETVAIVLLAALSRYMRRRSASKSAAAL